MSQTSLQSTLIHQTAEGALPVAKRMFRLDKSFLGILPFLALIGYFFFYPLAVVFNESIHDSHHHLTASAYKALFGGDYRNAFIGSFELAAYSMAISAIIGALICWAVVKTQGHARKLIIAAAGVLTSTGGIPLAFSFIAAFGQEGLVTKILLNVFHWDIYGGAFDIYNFWGILLVYCFFQAPLMVIIFIPAVENLKVEWQEANETLGGSRIAYLRFVVIPVLAPAFISSCLLLFASGFSAYATAAAMSNGTIPLVPLLIGNLVNGEVLADQANQGDALAMGMILVCVLVFGLYALVMRVSRKK